MRTLLVVGVLSLASTAAAEPAELPPLPRFRVGLGVGLRLAPWSPRGSVAQGLVLSGEVAFRARHDVDLYLRGTMVGLDQAATRGIATHPIEHTTVIGVRRRLGRFYVESEAGVRAIYRDWDDQARPQGLVGTRVGARIGCLGGACIEASIGARLVFGDQGLHVGVEPGISLVPDGGRW